MFYKGKLHLEMDENWRYLHSMESPIYGIYQVAINCDQSCSDSPPCAGLRFAGHAWLKLGTDYAYLIGAAGLIVNEMGFWSLKLSLRAQRHEAQLSPRRQQQMSH